MKNNIFKSFRFEIIMCSMLSLVYTLMTQAVLYISLCSFVKLVKNAKEGNTIISNIKDINPIINNLDIGKNKITNSNNYRLGIDNPSIKFNIGLIIGVGILIGIILFILFFLLLTRKFAFYLEDIAKGVNHISAGDFSTRIDIKGEDEFAIIAGRLNKMADDINKIMENDKKNENTKNEMIASVAHDLRTPLTSIIGYLELVSNDTELDIYKTRQYVGVAYNKAQRLEKLIEDLFTYTKFSFGEVTMRQSEVDLVKFIEQLSEEFYPGFQESNLEYEIVTNYPSIMIMADGDLLARAFANLIGNAVKYGKDGKSIKIRIEKKEKQVIISIINYGELIPEKDLNNIFDKFFRVESSRSTDTGGTGLGLAIAKTIILMHNGTLSAKSDFDGTVFEVTLNLIEDR